MLECLLWSMSLILLSIFGSFGVYGVNAMYKPSKINFTKSDKEIK
jgi:hypothetical protein